jgi:hypothetical protein
LDQEIRDLEAIHQQV